MSLQTLKDSKQRHDIAALWMWCRSKGLALAPVLPSAIAQLAKLHGEPYPLRYADDEVARLIFSPDADLLQEEVAALLQLVSNSL